ncbi:TIGR03752 family integrating conjugative element protein [uncultured Cocleimonas sp.]|jgi:cell division protein ZapB|uniref:TIGR03752 family integrating conjugative element protein n=1 Tax=uncultured Cocleimonas sp. TaxID=1051587 RepID=UPI002634F290|nr:TIGR03752 family integrating conjugative element protein [uncultured Cocleimonas sp.]
MASSKSSKMLPIITLLIVAVVGAGLYVNFFLFDKDGTRRANLGFNSSRMKSVQVDADLPVDTLNTLAEKSATFESQVKGVREATSKSSQEILEMRKMMKQMVESNSLLQQKLDQQNREMTAVKSAVSSNNNKTLDFEAIKENLVEAVTGNIAAMLPNEAQTEYPISTGGLTNEPTVVPETTSRVRAYGAPIDKNGQVPKNYLDQLDQSSNDDHSKDAVSAVDQQPEVVVDPRYTIPADAVLNDSITITALIGRIPKSGNIGDPAPFKVAIGRENLAANGFSISGLDGMIMSGVVYGDSVRSCVITKIRRATYIFEDGRILTLPRSKTARSGSAKTSSISAGNTIGYLTDPYGDPCIKGRLYSNGNAQLRKSILANMAAGAANAYAQTQVTTLTDASNIASAVTGNDTKFVTGSAIAEGAQSVADILKNQEFDSWDQVVVPVGTPVTINIDQQLEIDNATYLRKLVYGQENNVNGLTD